MGMNDGKLNPGLSGSLVKKFPVDGAQTQRRGKALCFWPEMNWQDGRAGWGRVTSLGSLWCLKLSSSRLLCFTQKSGALCRGV